MALLAGGQAAHAGFGEAGAALREAKDAVFAEGGWWGCGDDGRAGLAVRWGGC